VTNCERAGAIALLSAHKMSRYFSGVISKDDGYPPKSNPAAFWIVMEKYNLDKWETISIGDRDIDLVASQDSGVFSCLLDNHTTQANPKSYSVIIQICINTFWKLTMDKLI